MHTVDLGKIPNIVNKLCEDEIILLNKILMNPSIIEGLNIIEKRRKILLFIRIIIFIISLSLIILVCLKNGEGTIFLEKIVSGFFNKISDMIGLIISVGFIYGMLGSGPLEITKSYKEELYNTIFPLFGTNFEYSFDHKYAFDIPYDLQYNILMNYVYIKYSTQFRIEDMKVNTEEYIFGGKENYFISKIIFNNFRIPLTKGIEITEDYTSGIGEIIFFGVVMGIFSGMPGLFVFFLSFETIGVNYGVILGLLISIPFGYHITKTRSNRVELENMDFEKLFDVNSEDQVTSRMLLTPAFMDRMVTFTKKTGHSGYRFLFQANCIHISRRLPLDYMCISTSRNLQDNLIQLIQFYIDTRESILLIKELNLGYLSLQKNK